MADKDLGTGILISSPPNDIYAEAIVVAENNALGSLLPNPWIMRVSSLPISVSAYLDKAWPDAPKFDEWL